MARHLSGRQPRLNIGISSYTESLTVLQVTGKVAIGTTNAGPYSLYVIGDTNIQGLVGINTLTSFSGIITNLAGTNINYAGIGTINNFISTTSSINTLDGNIVRYNTGILTSVSGSNLYYNSGIVTNILGTNLNYTGIGTVNNFISTTANITNLSGDVLRFNSGIVTNIQGTNLFYSGIGTIGSFLATNSTILTLSGSAVRYSSGIITNISGTNLNYTGISTFTAQQGPLYVGSATSTGTPGQTFQVVGVNSGAFFGGNVGIGSTLPTSKLSVQGDVLISGVVTSLGAFVGVLSGPAQYSYSSGFTTVAVHAGVSTISSVAGFSSVSIQAGVSTIAAVAGFATVASIAGYTTYSGTAGFSSESSIAGFATVSAVAGFATVATHAGVSTRASVAGFATVSSTAGFATVATQAGFSTIATNVIGGVGDIQTLQVTGVSTFSYGPVLISNTGSATSTGTAAQPLQVIGGAYVQGNLGIGSTRPSSKLSVQGDVLVSGVVTSQSGFFGNLTGIAASATQLVTPRDFSIIGAFVNAPTVAFDGTANVALAATVLANSIGLGTYTSGDYVRYITGTPNQITVTGGLGEGSTPQISLPSDVSITNNLNVGNDLFVGGNLSIAGTSVIINTSELRVEDKNVVVGFTTLGSPSDTTANLGGLAIASTEGTPLVPLQVVGFNTTPETYKQIVWVRSGTWAGLTTDAFIFNYGVGIGSTQVPNGVRLAVGSGIQMTDNQITADRFTGNFVSANTINATNQQNTGVTTSIGGFIGQLTGAANYAYLAGVSTYAYTSGFSTVASVAGFSTVSSVAGFASISNVAGVATFSTLAGSAGFATVSTRAGVATFSTLAGSAGFATVSSVSGFSTVAIHAGVSTIASVAGFSSFSNIAGVATFSTLSGSAGFATVSIQAGVSTFSELAGSAGFATVATQAGVATLAPYSYISGFTTVASQAGVATYAYSAGFTTYATFSGVSTIASVAGFATNATRAGIATYSDLSGSAGFATVATRSGVSTLATYAYAAGFSTVATYAGIATISSVAGFATISSVAGFATNATYAGIATIASVAGFATVATQAGISTSVVGGVANITSLNVTGVSTLGIVTATRIGIGTLSPTSELTVYGDGNFTGVVTANSFYGNFFGNITGVATYAYTAGFATVAIQAGFSTISSVAGFSTVASVAGFATNATRAGLATFSTLAGTAGFATVSSVAGFATVATQAGVSTISSIAGFATVSGVAGFATISAQSGVSTLATYSYIAGFSTVSIQAGVSTIAAVAGFASVATQAGVATFADISSVAGFATVSSVAGVSTLSQYSYASGFSTVSSVTGLSTYSYIAGFSTVAAIAGFSTVSAVAGFATNATRAGVATFSTLAGTAGFSTVSSVAGFATVSSVAGFSTVSGVAGFATVATQAGISTSVVGGVASVQTLQVTGVSTFVNGPVLIGTASSTGTLNQDLQVTGGVYISDNVGIGSTNPPSKLSVVGDASIVGVVTANRFFGPLTGIAASATQLVTPRDFSITGSFVNAPSVSFDGTSNVALAATVLENSIGLGTYTYGDYVSNIVGTTNQITVTGGSGERSTPQIGLSTNVTIQNNVTIGNDLFVGGNVTVAGTSFVLSVDELRAENKELVIGFTTATTPNDTTANFAAIAIASTEGTPLVPIAYAGLTTLPTTYKQLRWVKSGTWAGLATDAFIFNYGVGIGSTNIPNGVRLAVGSGIQMTDTNISTPQGQITGNLLSANTISASNQQNSGVTTSLGGFIGNLRGAANYAYAAGFSTFSSTAGFATVASIAGFSTQAAVAGFATNATRAGVATFSSLAGSAGFATVATQAGIATNVIGGVVDVDTLRATGIATFSSISVGGTTGTNQYVLTSTGTGLAWQAVTGIGAITGINIAPDTANATRYITFSNVSTGTTATEYVSSTGLSFNPGLNRLGIGTANPSVALDVVGSAQFTGVVTAATFYGTFVGESVARYSEYAYISGFSSVTRHAGVSTIASVAGFATVATQAGIATLAPYAYAAGFSTFSGSAGFATVATQAGVSTISAVAGFATVSIQAGVSTISAVAGFATVATVAGVATFANISSVAGFATVATRSGVSTLATYAYAAGFSTVATVAGVATFSTLAGSAGFATVATQAGIATSVIGGVANVTSLNVTGVSTLGIVTAIRVGIGTTNATSALTVYGDGFYTGVITATSFFGNFTGNISGVANYAYIAGFSTVSGQAGVSTIAAVAGFATNATRAGVATFSTLAGSAGFATVATVAGVATFSTLAGSAGFATVATQAGIATLAPYAYAAGISTVSIVAGVATFSTLAGAAGFATVATQAGVSTIASVAGFATIATRSGVATYSDLSGSAGFATVSSRAGVATFADLSGAAGFATVATRAGVSTLATYAYLAGFSTVSIQAGVSTIASVAGFASVATQAGVATFANISSVAGFATVATQAGISTSVIGGVANVTSLQVSGISTFQGNVNLGDNDILSFGDGNDLQIYHDGTNSYIDDAGTGDLYIRSNAIRLQKYTGETTAVFLADNAVELYYDNSKKFETTTVGIAVSNGTSNTATITGPNELIIDPAPTNNSGSVRIKGDLYVDGTQFVVNSTTIELADFVVGIATTVGTNTLLDGAGIGIGSDNIRKTITWNNTAGSLTSSEDWNLVSGKQYEINGTSVLNATTLGSGVVNSSLTSVGTLGQLNVSGVTTSTGGFRGQLTGVANYAYVAGFATVATVAGVATFSTLAGSAGFATNSTFSGVATFAQSSAIAGFATYAGNVGFATFAGVAGFASFASVAGFASAANSVVFSPYAYSAGFATVATHAGVSTISSVAGFATLATYSYSSGFSTVSGQAGFATNLRGGVTGQLVYQTAPSTTGFLTTGNLGQVLISGGAGAAPSWSSLVGLNGISIREEGSIVGTANSTTDINFVGRNVTATATGIAATITILDYVSNAAFATFAPTSGFATFSSTAGFSTVSIQAGVSTIASVAGFATVSIQAGVSTISAVAGFATNATRAGVATFSTLAGSAGFATVSSVSGFATVSSVAGFATVSTQAGISTSVIGGVADVTSLRVAGISTFTSGPVLIGSGTSTGTASQRLQVTGGGYFSNSVGIGTTNPFAGATNLGLDVNITNATIHSRMVGNTGESSVWASDQDFYSLPSFKGIGIRKYGTSAAGNVFGSIPNADSGVLVFQNTANAIIHTNGGTPLIIATVNTEAVRIDTSQRIGINSSSPTARLDVGGDARISGALTAVGGFNIGIQSSGIPITTGVVTALNFIGSGNTFSYNPTTKTVNISIVGGGGGGTSLSISTSTSTNFQYLSFVSGVTTNTLGIATPSQPLGFTPSNGFLGVGTINPTSRLTVFGDTLITGVTTSSGGFVGQLTGVSNYSYVAGFSTFASTSGFATNATRAGVATFSTLAGSAGFATVATVAGVATFSTLAGSAGFATVSSVSGVATFSNLAGSAGFSTFSSTSGFSTFASISGFATVAAVTGFSSVATHAGVSSIASVAGFSTFASTAGFSTFASTSGFSTMATIAGIATNVVTGVASIRTLQVTGISTFTFGPVYIGAGQTVGITSAVVQIAGINSSMYVGGKVGIGTTDFTYALNVNGDINTSGVIRVNGRNILDDAVIFAIALG